MLASCMCPGRMMRKRTDLILLLAIVATAGAQPVFGKESEKKAEEPNDWICEKQPIIGSRLTTRRVCATRSEWIEKRRLDRDAIDKAQTQIGVIKI